jgi:hypothetical protein
MCPPEKVKEVQIRDVIAALIVAAHDDPASDKPKLDRQALRALTYLVQGGNQAISGGHSAPPDRLCAKSTLPA